MILIIWLGAIVATWLTFLVAVRRSADEPATESASVHHFGFGMLLTLPPTILWAICSFVLLQAAPTVQLNAGNDYALELWSFWVDAWEPLFVSSIVLFVVYLVSSIIMVFLRKRYLTGVSIWALVASGIAYFVLRIAFPSA